jgi:hypothetical protein
MKIIYEFHRLFFSFLLGIVNLDENQSDLEQGNKLAVLGGDYLLSQACGKLAEFQKPKVRFDNLFFDLKSLFL